VSNILFSNATLGTSVTGVYGNTGFTFNQNTGQVSATTYVSTVATGTAPFTVASTTNVANLNASSVNGYTANSSAVANTLAARDTGGGLNAVGITGTSLTINSSSTAGIYQSGNVAAAMGMTIINANASGYAQLILSSNALAKTLRTNNAGTLELVNNANNSVIFNVTDSGNVNAYCASTTSLITSQSGNNWGGFYAKSATTNNSYMFFGDAGGEKGRITSSTDGSMLFGRGTSALTTLNLDTNGNVQIGGGSTVGAVNTLRFFDVYNTDTGASAGAIMRLVTSNAAGNANISVDMVKYKSGAFNIFNNESTAAGVLQLGTAGTARVIIDTSGNVTATGNITAYFSDDRLKTRTGNIENALDKLASLDTFYYHANETAEALGFKAVPEVGISAQQVQAVMPEVVAPAPVDAQYLTVRYERLVPLLIAAIKELQAEVELLKAAK
jgi:hypothetical protein